MSLKAGFCSASAPPRLHAFTPSRLYASTPLRLYASTPLRLYTVAPPDSFSISASLHAALRLIAERHIHLGPSYRTSNDFGTDQAVTHSAGLLLRLSQPLDIFLLPGPYRTRAQKLPQTHNPFPRHLHRLLFWV